MPLAPMMRLEAMAAMAMRRGGVMGGRELLVIESLGKALADLATKNTKGDKRALADLATKNTKGDKRALAGIYHKEHREHKKEKRDDLATKNTEEDKRALAGINHSRSVAETDGDFL